MLTIAIADPEFYAVICEWNHSDTYCDAFGLMDGLGGGGLFGGSQGVDSHYATVHCTQNIMIANLAMRCASLRNASCLAAVRCAEGGRNMVT